MGWRFLMSEVPLYATRVSLCALQPRLAPHKSEFAEDSVQAYLNHKELNPPEYPQIHAP